jgi:trans-aconitate methyltransferase
VPKGTPSDTAAALDRLTTVEMMKATELNQLLAEQAAYYGALSPDYLEGALDLPGGTELEQAIADNPPRGAVLELACGPATWTAQLLTHATTLTAVDGSHEMLTLARARLGHAADRVRFVHADLFSWRPAQVYDSVFFGFWLSHVPLERFAEFWALLEACLAPGGRVLFVDDAYRTPEELVEGATSSTIQRQLPDGRTFRAIKVPHTPASLQQRLVDLGWDITVSPTAGPFYWGLGGRAR